MKQTVVTECLEFKNGLQVLKYVNALRDAGAVVEKLYLHININEPMPALVEITYLMELRKHETDI